MITLKEKSRTLLVPSEETFFGVTSDKKVETRQFEIPRMTANGKDLSSFALRINYFNAENIPGQYSVKDAYVNGDKISFSWEFSGKVTAEAGKVRFIICAVSIGESGEIVNEWNTEPAEGIVKKGLEVSSSANDYEEDIPAAVENALILINQRAQEVLDSIPDDYTTLTDTVDRLKEDVSKLSEDIDNLGNGSGLTDILKSALRTYFTNMQTLLTQLAYVRTDNIGNTLISNAQAVVTALDSVVSGNIESISVSYSGGSVPAGTDLSELKNNLVVTATYDDGMQLQVMNYTLSGEIVEGENIITVTYRKQTATFTVTGLASYTITYNLTNVESSVSTSAIVEGGFFETILSYDDEVYDIFSVVIIMGGLDVTSAAYADGIISIPEVTGNIVITATAAGSLEIIDITPYLKKENSQLHTFYQGTTIRWGDVTNNNIYSISISAGTYRLSSTIAGQYDVPIIQNSNFRSVSVGKLPILANDTDLSTNSIAYTEAESCTYTNHGLQEDNMYLWTLDIVFATDGYFLFSVNMNQFKSFAKVVE